MFCELFGFPPKARSSIYMEILHVLEAGVENCGPPNIDVIKRDHSETLEAQYLAHGVA